MTKINVLDNFHNNFHNILFNLVGFIEWVMSRFSGEFEWIFGHNVNLFPGVDLEILRWLV